MAKSRPKRKDYPDPAEAQGLNGRYSTGWSTGAQNANGHYSANVEDLPLGTRRTEGPSFSKAADAVAGRRRRRKGGPSSAVGG